MSVNKPSMTQTSRLATKMQFGIWIIAVEFQVLGEITSVHAAVVTKALVTKLLMIIRMCNL